MDKNGDRRQQVLQAALRLFAARGFEATGVRSIADEVGVTPSSLYNYGTKEDLLVSIMHSGLDELITLAEQAIDQYPDAPSRLVGLVRSHVRVHAMSQDAALVADSELRALGPANYRTIVQRRREYEQLWAKVIEQGVAAGQFHVTDLSVLRLSLVAMCTGVGTWYSRSGRLSVDMLSEEMERLALMMAGYQQTDGPLPAIADAHPPTEAPTEQALKEKK